MPHSDIFPFITDVPLPIKVAAQSLGKVCRPASPVLVLLAAQCQLQKPVGAPAQATQDYDSAVDHHTGRFAVGAVEQQEEELLIVMEATTCCLATTAPHVVRVQRR